MEKFGTIKLANIQLELTDESQVVKIAGIIQKVKNWIRSKIDSEFRARVDSLKEESAEIQNLIFKLNELIKNIQNSIENGNVEKYKIDLVEFKKILSELISSTKIVSEESKDFYFKNEIGTEEFKKRFKESLPTDFDIEIDREYSKDSVPLKQFKMYSSISHDLIFFDKRNISFKKLMDEIFKKISDKITKEEFEKVIQINGDEIVFAFKQAILDGILLKAIPYRGKNIERQPYGKLQLIVRTAPFFIKDIPGKYQVVVGLIDSRTSNVKGEKISINRINNVIAVTAKTQLKELYKKALLDNQLPYKVTTLSDIELANTLREGYKKVFGKDPTAQALAGGWAQVVLEAGVPIKLPNNNIGNIKAGKEWINSGKPYFSKETGEFTKDGKFYKTPANWKAFLTPVDGAVEYWNLLKNRYGSSLAWMEAEDPTSATIQLGLKGYFTADIKKYSGAVSSLYLKFMKEIAPKMSGLKFNKKSIPSLDKPELKSWTSEYKEKSEKSQIDSLMKDLTANNILTNRVKTAILKKSLSETLTLTVVNSDNLINGENFAKNASAILYKLFETKTRIFEKDKQIYIQALTIGSPIVAQNAIQGIMDCVSVVYNKDNKKISTMTVPNILIKHAKEIC